MDVETKRYIDQLLARLSKHETSMDRMNVTEIRNFGKAVQDGLAKIDNNGDIWIKTQNRDWVKISDNSPEWEE